MDVQNGFEFLARVRADGLDGCAAFADQDCLLSFAFHVEGGADSKKLWTFLKAVDHHRNRIGHFVARGENRLLANDFRSDETLRLVGKLVLRKIGLMLRQSLKP